MKKIIMFACIISLACFASTDVKAAPTLNEIVSSAANATIESARTNGTGFEFDLTQSLTYSQTQYSPTGTTGNAIVSSLSNMRAQAELYYSYNNETYGPKTQSCFSGIFKDSKYGLSNFLGILRGNSKEISCISTGTGYAVSAKVKTGEYWCIDSAGNSRGIAKILKKGSISCDSGVKIPSKPVTRTAGEIITVYPTTTGFDLKYSTTGEVTSSLSMPRILRSGISYFQVTKEIDSEVAHKNKGLYVGRYVEIPAQSYVYEYLSLKTDIQKYLDLLLNPTTSSVTFIKTNPDSSSVYQVSAPFLAFRKGYYYLDKNEKVKIFVTIKNGIITSIISNSQVASEMNSKVILSLKSKSVPNTLNAQLQGTIISCIDYFDEDEYCSAEAMKASLEDASQKGKSASIQATLSNMRAQAELYYSLTNNTYGAAARSCGEGMFGSTDVGGLSQLVSTAKNASPDFMYCASNGNDKWTVSAALPTGGYFCVDSAGVTKQTTVKPEYPDMICK